MRSRPFSAQVQGRYSSRFTACSGAWAVVLLMGLAGCQPQEKPQNGGQNAPKAKPIVNELPAPPTQDAGAGPSSTTAGVGAGEKGRGYGDGLVTPPVAAYFSVQERLVFDVQIPHAMQLYKAIQGHSPKTHDEFIREIITANQIRLPTLPAGHRYVYDPKSECLMVEHPKE